MPKDGVIMDPDAVVGIARELGELADALAAAAAFAGAGLMTQPDFGQLPASSRAGGRYLEAVASLAKSFGYVATLIKTTDSTLRSAAGLQQDNEAQTAATLGASGSAVWA
ncbi:hypothetical protein [Actinokineospora sp.]|uniref:hypothetical protein n=1 Tax=Actinokineospora sp. TaxID=1872133 RepID=UPI003D6A5260